MYTLEHGDRTALWTSPVMIAKHGWVTAGHITLHKTICMHAHKSLVYTITHALLCFVCYFMHGRNLYYIISTIMYSLASYHITTSSTCNYSTNDEWFTKNNSTYSTLPNCLQQHLTDKHGMLWIKVWLICWHNTTQHKTLLKSRIRYWIDTCYGLQAM